VHKAPRGPLARKVIQGSRVRKARPELPGPLGRKARRVFKAQPVLKAIVACKGLKA